MEVDGSVHAQVQPVSASFPLTNAQAKLFHQLCTSLVANYPALLQWPDEDEQLRAFNIPEDSGHAWYFRRVRQVLEHRIDGQVADSAPAAITRDLAVRPAVLLDGHLVRPQLEHTLGLSRLVAVWSDSKTWRPSRCCYARQLQEEVTKTGQEELTTRAERWVSNAPTIGDALATLEWKDLRSAPGMHARTGELWHRLKLYQLRSWSTELHSDGCTRAGCTCTTGADSAHIVWHCTRARGVWKQVARAWESQDSLPGSFARAVFSWQPPSPRSTGPLLSMNLRQASPTSWQRKSRSTTGAHSPGVSSAPASCIIYGHGESRKRTSLPRIHQLPIGSWSLRDGDINSSVLRPNSRVQRLDHVRQPKRSSVLFPGDS